MGLAALDMLRFRTPRPVQWSMGLQWAACNLPDGTRRPAPGKGQKRPKSNTKDTYLSFTSEASPFAKQSTLQKPEFLNIMRCSVRRHSLPSDFGLMCLYSAVELQELAVASTPGETCEGQRFVNEEHWRQSSNLFSLPDSGRGESH